MGSDVLEWHTKVACSLGGILCRRSSKMSACIVNKMVCVFNSMTSATSSISETKSE
jgi:hypothetical protein